MRHELRLADRDRGIAEHAAVIGPAAAAGGIDRAALDRRLDVFFGQYPAHQSSPCKSVSSSLHRLEQHRRAERDVVIFGPFFRRVAAAVAAGDEDHRRLGDPRHPGRVVPGARRHAAMRGADALAGLPRDCRQHERIGGRRQIVGNQFRRRDRDAGLALAYRRRRWSSSARKRSMSGRCSARASISSRARDGTTLAAFGSIENSPTVAAKCPSPLRKLVAELLDLGDHPGRRSQRVAAGGPSASCRHDRPGPRR